MTSPNPIGFFGLALPESVAQELNALDHSETAEVIADIAYSMTEFSDGVMCSDPISGKANDCIYLMTTSQKIALIRWSAERLDYLAHEKNNAKAA